MERFNPSCTPFSTYLGLPFADDFSAVVNIDKKLSIEMPLAPIVSMLWYSICTKTAGARSGV
jgi:hypothetical protein